jgi:hypothetical protein
MPHRQYARGAQEWRPNAEPRSGVSKFVPGMETFPIRGIGSLQRLTLLPNQGSSFVSD